MAEMPRPRLPHVQRETTRHGRTIWYFRRVHGGPRARLPDEYGSEEFLAVYYALLAGKPADPMPKAEPGTVRWLVEHYRSSPRWQRLAEPTRRRRTRLLDALVQAAGHMPPKAITRRMIQEGFDRRADKPESANLWLKTVRQLLDHAVRLDIVESNIALKVNLFRSKTTGFAVWTHADLATFEARWPIGTRERLAYDIIVYTGLRRSDAVRIGPQHVRDGVLTIQPGKTSETSGVTVYRRVPPPLAASIAATRTGERSFIATASGGAFTPDGFGNWFREACRAAGVGKSAHGIRKAAATRAAEDGATVHELMALFGWVTVTEAELYTREADRRRLSLGFSRTLPQG